MNFQLAIWSCWSISSRVFMAFSIQRCRLLERMWGTFNVGFWSWVNGIWEDLVPLDFILEMNQQVYEVRKKG